MGIGVEGIELGFEPQISRITRPAFTRDWDLVKEVKMKIPPNPPFSKGGRGDLVALSNRKEVVEDAYSTGRTKSS